MLAHFQHGAAFALPFSHFPGLGQGDGHHLGVAGPGVGRARRRGLDLLKNPGIAQRPPANGQRVAPRGRQGRQRACAVHNIAVGHHGNIHRLPHPGNGFPIRPARILLHPGAAMHGKPVRPGGLHQPGEGHGVFMRFIPAQAHFHRHGQQRAFFHLLHNPRRQEGIFHQGAARLAAHHLLGGAAHIQINAGEAPQLCQPRGGLGHKKRLAAKKLNCKRPLLRRACQKEAIGVAIGGRG